MAGATADILDRRKSLIFWQAWTLGSVGILACAYVCGVCVSRGDCWPLTFLLNIGSAMNNPAWQAIVPELVPREDDSGRRFPLNAAEYNLARAVGPALGGLTVAAFKHPLMQGEGISVRAEVRFRSWP